jgi:hypothetical protein
MIKEFELFERSEFSNSQQIARRARCPQGQVARVPFLLVRFRTSFAFYVLEGLIPFMGFFGHAKKMNNDFTELADPIPSDLAQKSKFSRAKQKSYPSLR